MFEGPDGRWYATRRDYNIIELRTRVSREAWVQIPGFSNYAVSRLGEIVNLSRWRIMSCRTHPRNGRVLVALTNDEGKQTTLSVGKLVAEAYVPLPSTNDLMTYDVGYLDGDVTNNSSSNLVWIARWKFHTRRSV